MKRPMLSSKPNLSWESETHKNEIPLLERSCKEGRYRDEIH
jgi:hypothetical protein